MTTHTDLVKDFPFGQEGDNAPEWITEQAKDLAQRFASKQQYRHARHEITVGLQAAANAGARRAEPAAQPEAPATTFTDQEMVKAAYRETGGPQGTKIAVAFNRGARWAREYLAAPRAEPSPLDPQPPGWVQCPECLAGFPLNDLIGMQRNRSPQPTQAGGECDKPPLGWRCTRAAGHDGPCAAIRDDRTISEHPPLFARGYATGYADGRKDSEQAEPTPSAAVSEREAFEAWALSEAGGWWEAAIARVGDGYHAGAVTKQWIGWQARAYLDTDRAARASEADRLDWLEHQGEAYGFEDMHEGNRWSVEGPFKTIRELIDAARKAQGGT